MADISFGWSDLLSIGLFFLVLGYIIVKVDE